MSAPAWEDALYHTVRAASGPARDALAYAASWPGTILLLAALWLLVAHFRGHLRRALFVLTVAALALGASDAISHGLKHLIERPRPESGTEDAFPSAHVANAQAAATAVVVLVPAAAPLLLLPPVVGWSRIYLGAHRPLDVLAGWLLGGLVGGGLAWGAHRWRRSRG